MELVPYFEISLAPTGRATCKKSKLTIEKGQLRGSSYYVPNGRNHYESTHFILEALTKLKLKKIIEGAGDLQSIRGFSELSQPAQDAATRIINAIINDAPIPEDAASFREIPPPKPRKRKADPTTPEQSPKKRTVPNAPKKGNDALPRLMLPVPLGVLRLSTTFSPNWGYRA